MRPTGPADSFFDHFSPFPMALKRKTKKKLITESQLHEKDTGSPQVQVRILTKEISQLTEHLQEHKKDHSGRRGLLGKVAQRRKLLNYLRMNKPEEYQTVLEANNLKK
jgi:small subunit ribosomal protein S15